MKSRGLSLALLGVSSLSLVSCMEATTAKPSKTMVEKKMESIAALAMRGSFLPPPIDGAKLPARDVELQLPRGCVPVNADGMVKASALVDDAESELLSACNIVVPTSGTQASDASGVKVTLVLIRHLVQIETGETAAAALLRSPGVLSATTTTATPLPGATMGPEVVLTLNAPSSAESRPSTALWYGAMDGLYVLYAEVDGDAESIAAWGDALTATLQPTASSHPIRWRAPTGLAPSSSAFGPLRMKLPEKVSVVSKTFNDLIGDKNDPLDPRDGRAFASIRDESGLAVGGSVYRAKLLPVIAPDAAHLARLAAEARGGVDLEQHMVSSSVGQVARVDATRADGTHEVYAVLADEPGEATVVHLVFAKDKWKSYAPFIDASLASIERGNTKDPY
jgi:hypothetical protein